jgi:hypothetical protein
MIQYSSLMDWKSRVKMQMWQLKTSFYNHTWAYVHLLLGIHRQSFKHRIWYELFNL